MTNTLINRKIAIKQLNINIGLAKTEMFTDEQNEVTTFAKAFGHHARVAIIQHVLKINACVCGDLVPEIGLAQPTISQHLAELKLLGLIKGDVEGTSVCYCINREKWTNMKKILSNFLDQELTFTTCC